MYIRYLFGITALLAGLYAYSEASADNFETRHDIEDQQRNSLENINQMTHAHNKREQYAAHKESVIDSRGADANENESNLFLSKQPISYYPEEGDDDASIMKSLKKSICIRQNSKQNEDENCKIINENISKDLLNDEKLRSGASSSRDPIDQVNAKNERIKLRDEIDLLYSNSEGRNSKEKLDDGNSISGTIQSDSRSMQFHETGGNSEVDDSPKNLKQKLLTILDCSTIKKRNPILIVSTIDGQISGINYETGAIIWSHKTGTGSTSSSLLSSSISKIEVTSKGEWIRLIPSLDGGIFRFDGKVVEPLPVTADTLLHTTFRFNEDTIFTGGKLSQIIGLSLNTGKVLYVCDINGCPPNQSVVDNNDVLIIKRISQTVRAIDPRSGSERWNFSVAEHELNIVTGDCDSIPSHGKSSSLPQLKFILPEGIIIGLQQEGSNMSWRQKLSTPIVSAWGFVNGDLKEINLFSSDSISALLPSDEGRSDVSEKTNDQQPALYVGIHEKQLYIQQNGQFKKRVHSALQKYTTVINGATAGETSFPIVQWQPYLATSLSRTPVLHHSSSSKHPLLLDYDRKEHYTDLVVKHNFDYPYDNGYYLYSGEGKVFNDSDHWIPPKKENTFFTDNDSFTEQIYIICFEIGPRLWWHSLHWIAGYMICHFLFLRYAYHRIRQRLEVAMEQRGINHARILLHNLFRENRQVLTILERLRVAVPALPSAEIVDDALKAPGLSGEAAHRQDSSYSSRYTSDFEPISCLGKGGFGVVFQVKNNLDENEYAIKRIILPSKDSSAERVKREVRALAKLNHTNIVRYYNSWLETPPPGWEEEKKDMWWKGADAASSSLWSPSPDESAMGKSVLVPSVKQESISGIIKKLNRNFEPQSSIVKSYLENDEIEPVSVFSEDSNDSNDVNYTDSSDSAEYDCNSSDDDCNSSVESFKFIGEDNDDSIEFKDDSVEFKDDSAAYGDDWVQFKEDSSESNDSEKCTKDSSANVDEITSNDYGKLTCLTVNKKDFSTATGKRRSTSLCLIDKPTLRRRIASNDTSSKVRPTSLALISRSSDPGQGASECKKVSTATTVEISKCSSSPRTYLFIQMELCMKESLKDWLFNNSQRDIQRVYSFFNDILSAVEYVHDQSLMHRDLKPSNIFFSLDGEIKIGDFGLVTTIEEETIARTPMDSEKTDLVLFNNKQRTLNAGTHLYMSPEQMIGLPYTYKVDIFSLGLILFEMLVPFSTEMERRTVLLQVREQKFPQGFSDEFSQESELLNLMLHKDPTKRLTTRGIRSREPLAVYQKDLDSIKPEEHYNLSKIRGHSRTHSGSFSFGSSFSSN